VSVWAWRLRSHVCEVGIFKKRQLYSVSKPRRKLNQPDGKSTGASVAAASGLISQRERRTTHTAPTRPLCSRALDYYVAINKNKRKDGGREIYIYIYIYKSVYAVVCERCEPCWPDWVPLVCHMPLVGIVCWHGVGGSLWAITTATRGKHGDKYQGSIMHRDIMPIPKPVHMHSITSQTHRKHTHTYTYTHTHTDETFTCQRL